VTHLRKMMLEKPQRRRYSVATTQRSIASSSGSPCTSTARPMAQLLHSATIRRGLPGVPKLQSCTIGFPGFPRGRTELLRLAAGL
jgi:hypothetical protein